MAENVLHESLWVATCPYPSYPPLPGDIEADVAIIGAGIVGILTAARQKQAGLSVALIESRLAAHGVTGFTTAKLTAVHTTIYSKLARSFGAGSARLYAEANMRAIDWAKEQVAARGIECDFSRRPLTLYVTKPDEIDILDHEQRAAQDAGLSCEMLSKADAPFPTSAALRFDGQAQFHIRKFLEPFLVEVHGRGSAIFEGTRALSVSDGEPCKVETDRGTVSARAVVLATMFPIYDPALYWARLNVYRDYAMAVRLSEPPPQEMLVGAGKTTYTYRTQPTPDGDLLIVSGLQHKEGEHSDLRKYYEELESYVREHFAVSQVAYSWSAQDYSTLDGVPYIGRISPTSNNIFVATGFDAWGMSTGIAASEIIADMVLGRESPFEELYDPGRFKATASMGQLSSNVANATKHLVLERIAGAAKLRGASLEPGEGAILETEHGKACIFRDGSGGLHALSPYCTHMGCQLSWNGAERTWDCGCHGSRFSTDGAVIQGPAVKDLESKPIP